MRAKSAETTTLSKLISSENSAGSETPFRAILRDLPDPVVFIDEKARIFYANTKAEKLFHIKSEEMSHISVILPPGSALNRRAKFLKHWRILAENGQRENFEAKLVNAENKIIDANITEKAILDESGNARIFSDHQRHYQNQRK